MAPKVRMRQSRSYGSSLQNFPPPKSGIACDNCGRRIAVSVPDPSTGAKTLLKPFEMAIGAGGEKRRRQSRQSEHFIRDCRDTSCSRFARSQGWLEGERGTKKNDSRRPWTREEEQELFVRAGYDSVKEIARKLRRSEQSVRSRLKGRSIGR